MTKQQEQLIALGAIFTAALQVDKLARTGLVDEPVVKCLINSLLVIDPQSTLDVYGGNDSELVDGYHFLCRFLERNSGISREALRYGLSLILLERKLSSNSAMLNTISTRLEQIRSKVEHFGIMHDNVTAACGALYEETISTFNHRIQVMGDVSYLQQPNAAAQIRTLLLAGIRSAMLWHQLGGRRWQLLFKRKKLLADLLQRLQY
ncbi:high frequency lysogenization protein HflD [Entomomonas sp. E2T0]|uniref:high frequency lysogenization protein HflD n=1 Tax=Entomomonas sp. E2T0 TaxID=2930213 RepID=UPI002228431D|nr:high frequency lysogenization protein HflD [Entomomonas sp. E2T0]UYZ84101.1 high frequency lysogenization protein HflD [Entomomonas sp. E2T0]